jgi:hypothetical protein
LASIGELRRLSGAAWPDELVALEVLRVASAAVRSYCGWAITTEDHVEVVIDGNGSRVLPVPCLHLTAVHEVEVDGALLTEGADYTWSASGVLYRPARWPHTFRGVRVVYSGGYEPPPAELSSLVAGLAGRLSAPAGVASWSVGSQTVTFNSEAGPSLSTVEEAVLERYRIVAGG